MANEQDTPEARFWAKVDRRGQDECWPWLAAHNDSGHGHMRWGGSVVAAHRISYILHHGAIPSGMVVRHTCDNAGCANPSHLMLGAVQENNADRKSRGRYVSAFGRGPSILPPAPRSRRLWPGGPKPRPVKDRFAESWAEDESGCWIWQLARDVKGYGVMTLPGTAGKPRRTVKAHRLSYKLFCGPVTDGSMVLHRCDVRACCNPSHLYLGSHEANMADMVKRGRAAKGKQNHFGRVKFLGERHARSKLTENAVREIRAAAGRFAQLAKKYGVSKQTVSHVKAGRTWRHIR